MSVEHGLAGSDDAGQAAGGDRGPALGFGQLAGGRDDELRFDAVLSVLSALGIIHIGVSYLTWPVAIAQGFGVPDLPVLTGPFHRVKGIRDVASGLVLTDRRRRGTAYGVHGETALLLVVNAGLWLLG